MLCRERQVPKDLLKRLHKFKVDCRVPLDARNRAVHDPLGVEDGKHTQLQITSTRKIRFRSARGFFGVADTR